MEMPAQLEMFVPMVFVCLVDLRTVTMEISVPKILAIPQLVIASTPTILFPVPTVTLVLWEMFAPMEFAWLEFPRTVTMVMFARTTIAIILLESVLMKTMPLLVAMEMLVLLATFVLMVPVRPELRKIVAMAMFVPMIPVMLYLEIARTATTLHLAPMVMPVL